MGARATGARRGRRRLWLGASLVLLLAIAGVTAHPAPAFAEVNPDLVTTALTGVTVHSGARAVFSFRVDDPAGGTLLADLVMERPGGRVVRTLAAGLSVTAGQTATWRGRISVRRGRYVYVVRATDAAGRTEAQATPAALHVLAALPPLVPTPRALRRALTWARARAGDVAVAVVDSRGVLHGCRQNRRFYSASMVKAMLLVAYLRGHRHVPVAMRGVLARMIEHSDNAAADIVYGIVGRDRLVALARLSAMRRFRPNGGWITTLVTAADLARFFRDMHDYIPKRHIAFADELLSGIIPAQSWGVPAAARPLHYRVYFKGGWLGAWVLASQSARLERRTVRLGLAVFTDGNPGADYGKETIRGVTARLLRP
ncbi:MAG: hypothetical protein WCI78_12645 [Mycobacterium sp.]